MRFVALYFACFIVCVGRSEAFSPLLQSPSLHGNASSSVLGNREWRGQFKDSLQQHRKFNPFLLYAREWEGDDIRWIPKMRRRYLSPSSAGRGGILAKELLLFLNLAFFTYQVINTVAFLKGRRRSYFSKQVIIMAFEVLFGMRRPGPLTMDFVHLPMLSRRQPHRYLTAGFIHAHLIHYWVNMRALRETPHWLETGLGWPLFVTTYLVGIVSGNIWHSWSTLDGQGCLGASGGICALYGLMFTSLVKMRNTQMSIRVLQNMGLLVVLGFLLDSVSNAAHIGGFISGVVMGFLCCPSYRKSYSLSRKNSLEVDLAGRDYRLAMGFGKVPAGRGLVPISLLWLLALIVLVWNPLYRRIPLQIYRGIARPGSLSSMRW